METPFFSRREFLRHLTLAGTATLLPLAAYAAPRRFVPVGRVSSFRPGQFRPVTLPGELLIYVRRLPGRKAAFVALSAVCTHKGCRVAWNPALEKFLCPCHGGQYDVRGRNIAGPPPRSLTALRTRVQDGSLYVEA